MQMRRVFSVGMGRAYFPVWLEKCGLFAAIGRETSICAVWGCGGLVERLSGGAFER